MVLLLISVGRMSGDQRAVECYQTRTYTHSGVALSHGMITRSMQPAHLLERQRLAACAARWRGKPRQPPP